MITDLLDWVLKTEDDLYVEDFEYENRDGALPPGYTLEQYFNEMNELESMLHRITPLLYRARGEYIYREFIIINYKGKEIEISFYEGQGTDLRISKIVEDFPQKQVMSWDTFFQAATQWSPVDQASYFINYIYSNGFAKIDERERYELYYYLGMYSHLGFFEALELYKNIKKNRG